MKLHVTGNGKTGIAFDMPAVVSCPGKTAACQEKRTLKSGRPAAHPKCYAMQGRYKMNQHIYQRNMDLIDQWLDAGIATSAIAEKIVEVLREAKGFKHAEWIRWHGSGDIYSPLYAQVLMHASHILKTWYGKGTFTYTRSYVDMTILPSILKLAEKCEVNLSADYTNWQIAADVYGSTDKFRRISCMHGENTDWIDQLTQLVPKHKLILFPEHSGGITSPPRKVGVPTCPAIIGAIPHENACQRCHGICHA